MSRSVNSVLSALQGAATVVVTTPQVNIVDELRYRTNKAPARNAGAGVRSTAPAPAIPTTAEGSDSRIVLRDVNTGEFAPAEDAGKKNITTDFVDLPKLSSPSLKAEKAKKATKKTTKKLATNKKGSSIGSAKKKSK